LSAHGGKAGFNAAAPLAPLVAAADRVTRQDQGAIVLIRARRRPDGGPVNGVALAVGEAVTR
jgi:hypothetical protein